MGFGISMYLEAILFSFMSTWHMLESFGNSNLNWENDFLRLPVGKSARHFLD